MVRALIGWIEPTGFPCRAVGDASKGDVGAAFNFIPQKSGWDSADTPATTDHFLTLALLTPSVIVV
jgi:hypothetical protein